MTDRRLFARAWPFVRPDAWALVYVLGAAPLAALAALIQPRLLKDAVDNHIAAGVAEGLAGVALLFLGAVAVGYLLESSLSICISWSGQRVVLRLRKHLYCESLKFSQRYFDSEPTGKILTRMTNDLDALGEAFSSGVVTLFLDILLVAGALLGMALLDWKLTASLLLLAPPLVFAVDFMRKRLRRLFVVIREALADVNAYLAERIDGVEVVQLFGCEKESEERFDALNKRFRDATMTSNIYDALMYALVDGASSICIAVLLWQGTAYLRGKGLAFPGSATPLTAGVLIAFIDYLGRMFRPLKEFSSKIAIVQRAAAALEKIFQLLDEGELAETGEKAVEKFNGRIVMKDVWFRYRPGDEDALKGVNLEVNPGEVVAIVGPTGSGKTTAIRLLDRSYSGYRGSITVDGKELRELRSSDCRRHLAAVRQDIQLFTDALAFNVDLGNPEISQANRDSAAELACADRIISRLGWEHLLKERGLELSVGEGRLVTFARAMAHDPGVILLDEATASVDSITEQLIQKALEHIFEKKTVIVVAHRLSTVRGADRIAVMESGKIVEQGRHEELMAKNGLYAKLVMAADRQML